MTMKMGLGLVLVLIGSGCAPRARAADVDVKQVSGSSRNPAAKAPLPTDTITAYREALERDDAAGAYRLLSPAVQQQLSLEKWTARWKETPIERAAQRKLLLETQRASSGGSIAMQAAIAMPQGTELLMAPASSSPTKTSSTSGPSARSSSPLNRSLHRSTDWQVADPDLAAVHAETPEQVLHLLIEAVEQRNYFALLRLLSSTERKVLETELRERIDRLRNSLNRKKASPAIEVHGDRAHYQYDPRFFVDLVRERDGWRVLDLN